ncbi:hypothetical protein [Autumnicola musiva]|uniref:Uncharacterized protein n=1 Tax=Autumnicola musiva TaxID=3075589 RepID=A0ABU3D2X9_9FLAO|nr:hypothetical protein [Zunongwangia sp. F117]MDT0675887.1 hypothetical protein [Zunongwangia sp. F117]
MDKQDLKKTTKNAGKLWLTKKGFQWTGGLIKVGVIAGLGYLGYKYYRDNQEEIEDKVSSLF